MEYVVFDLETTGLSPERDAIVEIGAMRVSDGELVEDPHFHSLVNPLRPVPYHAYRVHGLGDRELAGAPTLEAVLPAFIEFVGDRPLVAHNAAFDLGFLRAAIHRHGLLWTPPVTLCTVQLSRRAFPRERSHKLDLVAQRYGLEFESRHRSIGDVRVTAQAFVRLCRDLEVAL
ncbi:DNA polymerase-3 subunit epsilon [Deinobacterium chartae]|uniref:DNA polymerase-3 subunit epsilon n=1 Tax=Deinobacterium chartae TaxID=521158 RepID=A0A841I3B3_9DEIO|nr:3'-5' exonuclease [Deinobacterium chartae]MBB6098910.1 DNA polymerase-3 subunit epsilon [Deinobacterium chartae]